MLDLATAAVERLFVGPNPRISPIFACPILKFDHASALCRQIPDHRSNICQPRQQAFRWQFSLCMSRTVLSPSFSCCRFWNGRLTQYRLPPPGAVQQTKFSLMAISSGVAPANCTARRSPQKSAPKLDQLVLKLLAKHDCLRRYSHSQHRV